MENVKFDFPNVKRLLEEGKTVFEIARMFNKREWSVRYLLRKNNCYRVVRWECDTTHARPADDTTSGQ